MEQLNTSKALFRGVFILTAAAVITKVLSALYRIPFQNIVGDVGFYIYQQVYPFYGTAVVLTTTGFPVLISKLYAERIHKGEKASGRLFLLLSFLYLQCLGFVCFLFLYFGANKIAAWMHDPHLAVLIRVVSLVFLTFPFVSTIRGYYQARGEMVPTALSQVGEQLIRVVTIIAISYLFVRRGYSLYHVGSGAMFGSITGSITAGIILFTFLCVRKEWILAPKQGGLVINYLKDARQIFKLLFFQGAAICLSGMLMVFIQMADSLNLYALLTSSGIQADMAKEWKGIFDRGQPLIQLGTTAATSMSLALVPLVTRERLAAKPAFLQDKIKLAIKVSIVIGIGASAGLWAIIEPANIMLFRNEAGSTALGILSFVILFSSIILTVTAILQGLGKLVFPAILVTAVLPIKYILNLLLVPVMATEGAAISSIVSLIIVSSLLLWRLRRTIKVSLFSARLLGVVLLAAAGMVLCLKIYLALFQTVAGMFAMERIGAAIEALSGVGLGGFLFMFIILKGKVFAKEELELLPFGSKLLRVIRH